MNYQFETNMLNTSDLREINIEELVEVTFLANAAKEYLIERQSNIDAH